MHKGVAASGILADYEGLRGKYSILRALQIVSHSLAYTVCCLGRGMHFEALTAPKGVKAWMHYCALPSGGLEAERRVH